MFRTNTAYDRWSEGRRLWGQLVNVSRGLSQQLGAQLAGAEHEALRIRYIELLTAFPVRLAAHLCQPVTADACHLPNETLLQAFDDLAGACERIRKTPIPFSYSVYIKQFVMLYAFIMPFGPVREFGYGTVIASMFTLFATMGLELLATAIEVPFGTDVNDLPLDQIAATIARDVRAILTLGA